MKEFRREHKHSVGDEREMGKGAKGHLGEVPCPLN